MRQQTGINHQDPARWRSGNHAAANFKIENIVASPISQRARVNALMHDMERAGIEIVNLISENRHASTPGIIEFGPQPRRQTAE